MPHNPTCLAILLILLLCPAGQSLAAEPQGGDAASGGIRDALSFDRSPTAADAERQVRVYAARIETKLVGFFDQHHAAGALPAETVDLVHQILGDAAKWVAHTQHIGRPRPNGWFDRKAWVSETRALRDAGFSDPLFWAVVGAMQRDDTGDRLRRAMSGARHMRGQGYPSEAALLVADLGLLVNWAKNENWTHTASLNQFRDEIYRELAAWCREPGPIEPAFERWWADLAVRLSKSAGLEQVQAASAALKQGASDRDDKAWLRHLALGALAIEAAWEHRGGG